MFFRLHSDARCPRCRHQSVWYGLKEEATGWKVLCECGRKHACGHEWSAGWVSMSDVGTIDEASKMAEKLV
jgi:hypothetical protein